MNKYRTLTRSVLKEQIGKAIRASELANLFLDNLMEERIEELIELLQQLEKDGKIDLDKGVNLLDHPDVYDALKKLEVEQQHRMLDYAWMMYNVVTETMSEVYKDTMLVTWELLAPAAQTLPLNIDRPLVFPEIKITDTYITSKVLPIAWCDDGKTYSTRIYGNVANFESKLAFVLEEGIEKGKGMEWMIKSWRKLTGTSERDAERLLRTEAAAMWSLATKESYLDMGIEYVEIINDGDPCEDICSPIIDEGPVALTDAGVGDDLPPYHPYCECSFTIWEGLLGEE